MIHEDITISGSFQASGSFILPRIPSNSLATATTGSMFYDTVNDVVKIYTGTGSTSDGYITVGAQSDPPGPPPVTQDVQYLLVAGGGGGGRGSAGGGGGAGGLKSSSLADVASGSTFTITVGAGGSGGIDSSQTNSNDGSDSSIAGSTISTITSTGGGAGANEGGNAGADGGSGGGGSYSLNPGDGTVGQGNDGGTGIAANPHFAGGGGGGAGAAGGNADSSAPGLGGIGKLSHITGTGSYYAGGGTGDFQDTGDGSVQAFAGGLGGGGRGGNYRSNSAATAAENGTPNTGGGGGGGTNSGAGFDGIGGAGGSGTAIFAYPTSSITAVGGTKTSTADGQYVHTFEESGTLTVGGPTFHTVAPGDHFKTVLYTGTNTSNQSITGTGFIPDLIWVKSRDFAYPNILADSVRGAGSTKMLLSDFAGEEGSTDANYANAQAYGYISSFDADGFSVASGTTNGAYVGMSSDTSVIGSNYVAWCWKAGGTAVSNTDGTIDSNVSVNDAAGFSIVKWVGTYANDTVGHGLSSAPELIIAKNLDTAGGSGTYDGWPVYASAIGNDQVVTLNSSAEKTSSSGTWGSTTPTSTVFTVQDNNDNNKSGDNIIAYCFTSITGYQKVGSYTGTGATGNAVTVGFKPRFLMIKSTSNAEPWFLLDSTRDTSNPRDNRLMANSVSGEDDGSVHTVDFTDTGFTANGTVGNGTNGNGVSYVYLAIA